MMPQQVYWWVVVGYADGMGQQSSAQSYPDRKPQDTEHSEIIREWIRGEHHFDQTKESSSTFLHKPKFSQRDLHEALIWANQYSDDMLAECAMYDNLAARQYPHAIFITPFAMKLQLGDYDFAPDTTILFEWFTDKEIRAVDMNGDDRFRRTIASLARHTQKAKEHKERVQRAIGRAQSPERFSEDTEDVIVTPRPDGKSMEKLGKKEETGVIYIANDVRKMA